MAINLDHVTEQITVTDTVANASLTVQPKGTGAFNIAAGSGGLNLSNGGTVTALTLSGVGYGYTTQTSAAISAPTTANGVQATATVTMGINTASVASGGTGYAVGNVLSVVGGTSLIGAATLTVTAVSGGVITAVSSTNFAAYSALPSSPVSVTGGSGSGATFNPLWFTASFIITNAGSGYVEQPTVTFSGGGGSGAAAYATVGSGTDIKSIGSTLALRTPTGIGFLVASPTNQLSTNYVVARGAGNPDIGASAGALVLYGGANQGIAFYSNGYTQAQLLVSHTASAVNYVNITGAATGGAPAISAQGSDTDITLFYQTKGVGSHVFGTRGTTQQFRVSDTGSAVNYLQVNGAVTGSGPTLRFTGSDTNIDGIYAVRGAGAHRFFTNDNNQQQFQISHTASAVNYVQATGGVTGVGVALSAQGSDSNIAMLFQAKGTQFHLFQTNGANQFGVAPTASAVNYVQVTGSGTGNAPYFITQGSDTNISFAYSAKGTGAHDFYTNGFSFARQFTVAHTASAVNYVQVTGAATGGSPAISAVGSDASVGLSISSKSNANIIFNSGGTTRAIIDPFGGVFLGVSFSGGVAFQALALSNQVNFIRAAGAATGSDPVISAQGSDTNIDLVLQPKGTGALQAQLTDSTATGGNARGTNAVDWQTSRNAASKVANGTNAVISGGGSNISSGYHATIAGGLGGTSSSSYTFVGSGLESTAAFAYASVVGGFKNAANGAYNFIGGGYANTGTSGSAVTTQSATMNGTTAVTLSGSNANIKVGQIIFGTYINGYPNDTYVAAVSGTSLTLNQAASGSGTATLSFYTPHGVVVGGGNNTATGSHSFIGGGGDAGTASHRNVASGDWSTVVGGSRNTASGAGSFVGGGGTTGISVGGNTASGVFSAVVSGFNNNASADGSFVGNGYANTANSAYSFIGGGVRGTTRSIVGNAIFPAHGNPIADASGINQAALLILGVETTNATATALRSNSSAASTTNQVILPNNSAYFFTGEVVAGVTGGGNTKGWTIEGVIKRGANAASTALVGTPTVTSTYADAGASTWVIAVTADTTNGGLAVTFTGQASTTIRTVAKISTVEMTF
jgi:hypothetical protein